MPIYKNLMQMAPEPDFNYVQINTPRNSLHTWNDTLNYPIGQGKLR